MAPPRRPGLLCALVLALAGCAADPPSAPPTGVDELVVPTPSPDPDDFVEGIDNPWLPLEVGTEWTYAASGGETTTVTVTEDTREVAGVDATVVRHVVREGESVVELTLAWYAEDRRGNVWFLGEETVEYDDRGRPADTATWAAGEDGAQAGLAMPAEPRIGDGYRPALLPGELEDRLEVLAVDGDAEVPAGSYDDLLVMEVTTPLEPGSTGRRYFARGVGLVLEESVSGDERVELVSVARD